MILILIDIEEEGGEEEGGGGKEDGMHSKTRTHTLWSGGKNNDLRGGGFDDVAELRLNVDLSMERKMYVFQMKINDLRCQWLRGIWQRRRIGT